MGTPQSGLLPEQNCHAIFTTLNLSGDPERVRCAASDLPALTETVAQLGDAPLYSALGIGSTAWDRLFTGDRPAELRPFKALAAGARRAPATPADLFLHVRSDRFDLAFELTRRFCDPLGAAVTQVEQIHGFRYLDSRDLTGFVDGTENPQGDDKAAVALVDDDPPFDGGSYVAIQRYVTDLAAWQAQPVAEQERTIGRTKADDVEFAAEDKPPFAHIKRSAVKEDGVSLEMLRRSMPYALPDARGLYFVAYTKHPRVFDLSLESMVVGDDEGHYDRLLDYTTAVTGARFFVPPADWLAAQRR